jgi:hypothetical protein
MNKIFFYGIAIMLLATSCNKIDCNSNPYKTCDVARYHLPYDDAFAPDYPVLFVKDYDASGTLEEMFCTFFNEDAPENIRQYELVTKYANGKLYILDKNNITDTVEKVSFDAMGRPIYAEAEGILNLPDNTVAETYNFVYKNNRLFSLATNGIIDTCFYDGKGNILSFNSNTYQYDYTREAKAQFYVDDFMQFEDGFYLLEYLELFPELTSPMNVRTRIDNVVNHSDITNQQFDADGKLISYQLSSFTGGVAEVEWSCDEGKNAVSK